MPSTTTNLGLPRFNLLDKPQAFDPLETYHYYYVDAGQVTTVEELYERLPYTGWGWYWRHAWAWPYFLRGKTTHGLKASEECPSGLLEDAINLIGECVETAYPLVIDAVKRQARKRYVLALIGLWGAKYQYSWLVATSKTEDDRLGALFKTAPRSDGNMGTETLSNVTMMPIHLIARNMEHVHVKQGIFAARMRGYGIRGIRVDCVYWDETKRCIADQHSNSYDPLWVDPEELWQEEEASVG